jgi:hypothetical protein
MRAGGINHEAAPHTELATSPTTAGDACQVPGKHCQKPTLAQRCTKLYRTNRTAVQSRTVHSTLSALLVLHLELTWATGRAVSVAKLPHIL